MLPDFLYLSTANNPAQEVVCQGSGLGVVGGNIFSQAAGAYIYVPGNKLLHIHQAEAVQVISLFFPVIDIEGGDEGLGFHQEVELLGVKVALDGILPLLITDLQKVAENSRVAARDLGLY